MEGPLSKWTNVMKGWQYRWFVLDENAGILSYYTSKEKMMRGSRRGCVRLKGAVIGIDDEDDSTFTITVDQKTFHFQARDYDERDKWISALEETIVRHTVSFSSPETRHVASRAELDSKLAETDAYLQILIDQVKELDQKINLCDDLSAQEKYCVVKVTAEAMIESIKQSIVMMQISKQNYSPETPAENDVDGDDGSGDDVPNSVIALDSVSMDGSPTTKAERRATDVIESSYSSSEDEDEFYDADETHSTSSSPRKEMVALPGTAQEEEPEPEPTPVQVIASKDDQFDELYDEIDDEDLDSLDQHSNMITYLLSQVRIGMDLTKVTLPTFILERRSLLEMYADFFAHPDLFCAIPDFTTPEERMIQVVRWYMSAFHAGRRSQVAKKPYNPILGETFLCYWDIPNMATNKESNPATGPIPWAGKDNLCFIAEQVSHHPPISAFYGEHINKRISLDGYIWTKSKFLGLSIGVHMVGQAVISVIDYDEEYMITFPNGYGRSILTIPWVELGGKINVTCAKTGYSANIDFMTKPFYGGKKHQVKGSVFSPLDKRTPLMTMQGEWNGVIWAQYSSGRSEKFVDTKVMPIVKKNVRHVDEQDEFESRRLWKHVTYYLKNKNVEKATEGKRALEQRQREEAKERAEKGAKWDTINFHEVGEHWVYDRPLTKRLSKTQESEAGPVEDEEYAKVI